MKLRSHVNGALIDISDEGAKQLIAAGIYDAVDEPKKDEPPKKEPKKTDKPTKVEPMTTEDFPVPTKQVT
jgi:hypothetical protein